MSDLPLLRPGILHFLGTFLHLDEKDILKDPNKYCLRSDKIDNVAMSFTEAINPKPLEDTKETSGGWQILCTGLGIDRDDLKMKDKHSPQSYVSFIWSKILMAQGVVLSMNIINKKSKSWVLNISNIEEVKNAMIKAVNRYENSPTSKSPGTSKNKNTYIILNNDKSKMDKLDKLGLVIKEALDSKKRILFLTADGSSARNVLPYLFKFGLNYKRLATSVLVTKDKRVNTNNKELHKANFLLLSANFFPLKYEPYKYDLVILWDFPSILNNLHVTNPLPNFIQMSRLENRQYPPSYYKDLWKVADIFHLVREIIEDAGEVWGIDMIKNSQYYFLEKLRGLPKIL
jgi:hypothetical protein